MPVIDDFIIGPVADVYVGDYGGIDVLTRLDVPRTQGGRYRYEKPDNWERATNNYVQSGFASIQAGLTFFWSEDAVRIASQNSLSTANIDDPPSGQQFTVLLLMADENSRSSILIPRCSARCEVENFLSKTDATTVPVSFIYRERNSQIPIQHRGTYDELAAILLTRSPI